MLVKLEHLDKTERLKITRSIGEAFASEKGGICDAVSSTYLVQKYMEIASEMAYRSGCLYTIDHTGYVAFYTKNNKPKLRYHFWMAYQMLKEIGYHNTMHIMDAMKGWIGYEKVYEAESNYLILNMLVIPICYQGQGRMKTILQEVFRIADDYHLKCVLDTDTKLKKDKYLACGMKLVKTTRLDSGMHVYVLEK